MNNQAVPYNNLLEFQRITQELNTYNDIDAILDKILFEARKMANADAGSIFLLVGDVLKLRYVQNDTLFDSSKGMIELYSDFSIAINKESIVGYTALTGEGVLIEDAYNIDESLPYHFNRNLDQKSGYRTQSIFTLPLKTLDSKMVGIMQMINARDENGAYIPFDMNTQMLLPLFANHAALAIERGIMNRELILRMMRMAELRDPKETGAHVQRVGAYSTEIYQQLAGKRGMEPKEIRRTKDTLRLASMLHDIGKIGIHDKILKKPGKLTDEEFHIMKYHTVYGAQLFTNTTSDLDMMSREIILCHHEKWNGKGYPGAVTDLHTSEPKMGKPMKGKEIPLTARITALADVYDALGSKRSYKDPWPMEKILAIIEEESGNHFDPEVVDAFFDIQHIMAAIRERYQDQD